MVFLKLCMLRPLHCRTAGLLLLSQVLDAAACAGLGMGCYLGVAEASLQPPAFIHLTYKPKGEAKKKVRETDTRYPAYLRLGQ
jgi:hypothetical protein